MQISDENSYESVANDNEQIIAQLKTISDTLADKSLTVLKQAHQAGETKRPDAERTLTQARRAIEKAIGLLTRS